MSLDDSKNAFSLTEFFSDADGSFSFRLRVTESNDSRGLFSVISNPKQFVGQRAVELPCFDFKPSLDKEIGEDVRISCSACNCHLCKQPLLNFFGTFAIFH